MRIIKQINYENTEVRQFLQQINPYITLDEPNVEIINENYKENIKSNKKEQQKNKTFSSACDNIMCPKEIYNHKGFNNWARRNHPDKKHADNSTDKEQINEDFKYARDCDEREKYCTKTKVTKTKVDKKASKELSKELVGKELADKEEEEVVEEVVEEEKSDTVTINDFKEGDNVKWTHNGKIIKGIVQKINKRKKKKIEILHENGTLKEIDISKLNIIK